MLTASATGIAYRLGEHGELLVMTSHAPVKMPIFLSTGFYGRADSFLLVTKKQADIGISEGRNKNKMKGKVVILLSVRVISRDNS